jgi:hypothetical protein
MVITASHFIGSIKNTDDFINQDNLTHLSKSLPKTIKTVMQACNYLFEKHYSLFLTGSLGICLRSRSLKEFRVSGDKSDVDLWIIANNTTQKSLESSCLKNEIIKGFSHLNQFDIVCIPFEGNTLKVSLKIMTAETAKKVFEFKKIKLAVLRYNSLKKVKTKNILYGMKKIHHIPIDEERNKTGGFLWHWSTNPFIENDFVLTDIHSCFLVGGFLTDNLNLKKARDLFLNNFFFTLIKHEEKITNGSPFKILGYFYERFPLSAAKIFGKEKGQIPL